MKKISSLVLACLGFAAISAHTSAYAGNRASAATFTLGAGYEFFDSKRKIKNATMPLFGLGYDFNQHWGIEGLLGIFNTTFKGSVNDNREISGTLFAINAVYHFSPYANIIEPYVMFGPGVTGLNPNRTDGNNEGNINAGVGAQFFIDKNIAFRVEARDFYTWIGGKNDFMLDGGVTFLLDLCN